MLIGFGGNDGDCAQYKGYLVSAPEDNRGANDTYTVPTSREGAIWSAGGPPAVDAAGNVYVPTGNATDEPGQAYDHGDTLEKLSATATELDYWAPSSWAQDSANDADLGSVSPELLPGNLIYQGGKNGNGYLISSASLGHIGGDLYHAPVCNSFGSDAYAAGVLYVACTSGIRALNVDTTGAAVQRPLDGARGRERAADPGRRASLGDLDQPREALRAGPQLRRGGGDPVHAGDGALRHARGLRRAALPGHRVDAQRVHDRHRSDAPGLHAAALDQPAENHAADAEAGIDPMPPQALVLLCGCPGVSGSSGFRSISAIGRSWSDTDLACAASCSPIPAASSHCGWWRRLVADDGSQ